jgi:hypothetical protein
LKKIESKNYWPQTSLPPSLFGEKKTKIKKPLVPFVGGGDK